MQKISAFNFQKKFFFFLIEVRLEIKLCESTLFKFFASNNYEILSITSQIFAYFNRKTGIIEIRRAFWRDTT